MVDSKGNIIDASKHVYNMAFGIYGLSGITQRRMMKKPCKSLFLYRLIEEKAKRDKGYL